MIRTIIFQQRDQFELHFEQRGKEERLNKDALKGFSAQMQVISDVADVWQVNIEEDNIDVSYASIYPNTYNTDGVASLHMETKIDPEIIKAHMNDVTCSYEYQGNENCQMLLELNEIEKDIIYVDGKGNHRVISTSRLKTIDPAHKIQVDVWNPNEVNESFSVSFMTDHSGTYYTDDGDAAFRSLSNASVNANCYPFLSLKDNDVTVLETGYYELEGDSVGIYKVQNDEIIPFLTPSNFQESLTMLYKTKDRLLIARQVKGDKTYLESYDFEGNQIMKTPLEYEEIKTVNMQGNKIMIEAIDFELSHNVYIYQYIDEAYQEIEVFKDIKGDLARYLYKNNRLYVIQQNGYNVYFDVYEPDGCILQSTIDGTLFTSLNAFNNINQQNNTMTSLWDQLMRSRNEFWFNITSFE